MSIKLTNEFLPSVYIDFGEGKLFSNKIAEYFHRFDMWAGNEYMYASNDDGETFYSTEDTPTPIKFPRVAMSISRSTGNNIKVNQTDEVMFYDDGYEVLHEGELIKEIYDVSYPSLLFYEGETLADQMQGGMMCSPALICMPQYASIIHDGQVVSEGEKTIGEGERFNILVEASKHIKHNYNEGVYVVADQRRFIQSSYRMVDNQMKYAPKDDETIDECVFLIGGKECDAIFLTYGSFLKLRTDIVDGKVLFIVENASAYKESEAEVGVSHHLYWENGKVVNAGWDYVNPIERIYATALHGGGADRTFLLSELNKKHWEDGVLVEDWI